MMDHFFCMQERFSSRGDALTPSICSGDPDYNMLTMLDNLRTRFDDLDTFISSWVPPVLARCPEDKKLPFADMMLNQAYGGNIFSGKAREVLSGTLGMIGVFLPVRLDGGCPPYFTWLTSTMCSTSLIQRDRSIILPFENRFDLKLKPWTSPKNLPPCFIEDASLFVHEQIKKQVEAAALTGIAFHSVTLLTADD